MISLELVPEGSDVTVADALARLELAAQFSDDVPEHVVGSIVEMQLLAQHAEWAAAHPRVDTYVITRAGTPVGRLLLAPAVTGTVILDLLVAAEHRGQGIGEAAMTTVVEQVPGPLELTVHHGDPIRSLCDRLGFLEVGSDHLGTHMRLDRRTASG